MSLPIEDYALIGDLHSAALVGTDGSIDWLCLPRFDSVACFSVLLGEDRHGHWRIGPADGGGRVRRRYLRDSLVLETEFTVDSCRAPRRCGCSARCTCAGSRASLPPSSPSARAPGSPSPWSGATPGRARPT